MALYPRDWDNDYAGSRCSKPSAQHADLRNIGIRSHPLSL
jgi:hypothetical protein